MNKMRQFLTILLLGCALTGFGAVVPKSTQEVKLSPGWNLVTLERPVVDDVNFQKFLALGLMRVEPDKGCYVRCATMTDLRPGVGYWVYSKTEQSIELTHDQSQTTWETVDLIAGWNLVGVDEKATWQETAVDIWQWTGDGFCRADKTEVTLGEGYWVKK